MTEPRFAIGETVRPTGYPLGRVTGRYRTVPVDNAQLTPAWHYVVNCGGPVYSFRESFLEAVESPEPVADSNDFQPMGQAAHDPLCEHPDCRIPW